MSCANLVPRAIFKKLFRLPVIAKRCAGVEVGVVLLTQVGKLGILRRVIDIVD